MSLKDKILSYKPSAVVEKIHAFGGDCFIRVISGAERDRYESSKQVIDFRREGRRGGLDVDARMNLANLRARLAAVVLSDEQGNRLFTDEDAAKLGNLDARELEKVYVAGCRLNGLDAEAIGDAEKNSVTVRNGSPGSASPVN